MLGKDDNPGIMAHALTELFTQMRRTKDDHVYKVTMSYLEVSYQQHLTPDCILSGDFSGELEKGP